MTAPDAFTTTLAAVDAVDGWMTDDQARRLWTRASALAAPARIVEIGSYHGRSTIVLARAAAPGVEVVAIDPHAGNDRGPGQWKGTVAEGQADHDAFMANLAAAGVAARVRHIRQFSGAAHSAVDGPVDLLYVDGAQGYSPARDDIDGWGARVVPGGTMLIHDSYSAVGVMLAQVRTLFFSGHWRYIGRSRTLTEFRREDLTGSDRLRNAGRQAAGLGYFARNIAIKVLLRLNLERGARALGHDQPTWPY